MSETPEGGRFDGSVPGVTSARFVSCTARRSRREVDFRHEDTPTGGWPPGRPADRRRLGDRARDAIREHDDSDVDH